jgi:hypothetical protein
MNIGLIGLIVVFAAFILLLIINPRLSCFGKRITSPLYPLMRKRRMGDGRTGRRPPAPGRPDARETAQKPGPKTEDYGFHLDDDSGKRAAAGKDRPQEPGEAGKKGPKTEDYGFRLDSEDKENKK